MHKGQPSAIGGHRGLISTAVAVGVGALVLVGGVYMLTSRPAAGEYTWVVTHNPVSVFDRAKDVFVAEFNKDSDTTISVKLVGPDAFETTERKRLSTAQAFDMLKSGEAQIATVGLNAIMKDVPSASVFSLPYLFKDDTVVEAALTGSVGQGILDDISTKLPVRALAVTFSGGWLVLQSNTNAFTTPAAFSGKRLTGTGQMAAHVLDTLGAKTEPIDVIGLSNRELNDAIDKYDGVETVFTRLHRSDSPKYVTVTNHALFATTIVIDDAFYASLSARDQAAFVRAATAASLIEREDSRALAKSNREDLAARGTQVIDLTDEQKTALAARMQAAYDSFATSVGVNLIESIRALSK